MKMVKESHYGKMFLAIFVSCILEISRGEKITFATDWWSLGVLSYELITGKVPIFLFYLSPTVISEIPDR